MSRANPNTTHNHAGIAALCLQAKAEINSWQDCHDFWLAQGDKPLWPGSVVCSRRNCANYMVQLAKRSPNVNMIKMHPHFVHPDRGGTGPHRWEFARFTGDGKGAACEYCGCLKGDGEQPSYGIMLYDTLILVYHADGQFQAQNGGHNTPTTSARLCQFGPKGWYFYHHQKQLGASSGWHDAASNIHPCNFQLINAGTGEVLDPATGEMVLV